MLHHHVLRIALPIHFFRHFICRIYHSATTHSEKQNRRHYRVWNRNGQHAGDHGYSRRGIVGGSVLQLYRTSAFLATATLFVAINVAFVACTL